MRRIYHRPYFGTPRKLKCYIVYHVRIIKSYIHFKYLIYILFDFRNISGIPFGNFGVLSRPFQSENYVTHAYAYLQIRNFEKPLPPDVDEKMLFAKTAKLIYKSVSFFLPPAFLSGIVPAIYYHFLVRIAPLSFFHTLSIFFYCAIRPRHM